MSAYATVDEGDAYFEMKLYTTAWDAASNADKLKALSWATRIIDRLNFSGEKKAASDSRYSLTGSRSFEVCLTQTELNSILAAGDTQELQFPRGSNTDIPSDIKIASYEIAYALLDGVDPDQEYTDQTVVSQGYSSVRTTYDRSALQEHMNAGIPSPVAWRYLKPYVLEGRGVKISRVS